jgi:hypothetical protein
LQFVHQIREINQLFLEGLEGVTSEVGQALTADPGLVGKRNQSLENQNLITRVL